MTKEGAFSSWIHSSVTRVLFVKRQVTLNFIFLPSLIFIKYNSLIHITQFIPYVLGTLNRVQNDEQKYTWSDGKWIRKKVPLRKSLQNTQVCKLLLMSWSCQLGRGKIHRLSHEADLDFRHAKISYQRKLKRMYTIGRLKGLCKYINWNKSRKLLYLTLNSIDASQQTESRLSACKSTHTAKIEMLAKHTTFDYL